MSEHSCLTTWQDSVKRITAEIFEDTKIKFTPTNHTIDARDKLVKKNDFHFRCPDEKQTNFLRILTRQANRIRQ